MGEHRIEATMLQMLNIPATAKAIGLTADQSAKIKQLTTEFDDKLTGAAVKIHLDKSLTEEQKAFKTKQMVEVHTSEIVGVLDELLTPGQREQLTSMFINQAIQHGGLLVWFQTNEMSTLLEYTPEQRKEVVALAGQLDWEYGKKCQQMRTDMLKQLAKEKLDAKQRAKLERVLKIKL